MLTLEQFASLAAIISAMADVYTVGRDQFSAFLANRQRAADYTAKGEILRNALSTYSDDEIDAIKERIEGCRDRFIAEGSGERRRACLCSVLSDVKDGNGDKIPFPDWARIYEQLGCDKSRHRPALR
jgi:hypothetical protein